MRLFGGELRSPRAHPDAPLRQTMRHAFAAILILALIALTACGDGRGHPFSQASRHDKPSADERAAALCAATHEVAGAVESPELIEVSGIAASREHEGVLWAHNDSGDSARVFAMDRGGRHLGTYTLPGAEAIDWEDMAVGPGPEEGVDYLYLADIGDNAAQRLEVAVYRVPEPEITTTSDTPTAGELTDVEVLTFRYPDHPHDAETLLIDPMSGDLLIVTKEVSNNVSAVFRALPPIASIAPSTLEQIATIDFSTLTLAATPGPDAPALVQALALLPTGGDFSRDGSLIAIRTYGSVWVWARPGDETMADVFATQPCEAPSAVEEQGEAIAFDPDGAGYITISEGTSPMVNHFAAE